MAPQNTVTLEHGERRDQPRVQDAVGLELQRLEDMPAAGDSLSGQDGDSMNCHADKYSIDGYAEVRRNHPEVIAYIDELEERIRQLLLDGDAQIHRATHKVSLSAGGLSFADDRLLHPGEIVGLKITLFPSGKRIGTDARVLSANDAPEIADGDKLTYHLSFVRFSDADRRVLEEHVQLLQRGMPRIVDDE